MNKKRYLIYFFILVGFIISILFIFKEKVNQYIDDYKRKNNFNYTYKISSELDVKGIVDDNNIIVQEEEKLIKYNLKKSEMEDILVSVENGYNVSSVSTFENGVIWIETRNTPTISSKIYMKNYNSDNILLIDETNENILPKFSISNKQMVYYITDKNVFYIKTLNLEKQEIDIIASYESSNNMYISQPSINDFYIVWSCLDGETAIINKYDIKANSIEVISDNDLVYNPVLNGGNLLAIKQNIYFDKEINDSYSSDYIVKFDDASKKWVKFKENVISNYVFEPREAIFSLSSNSELLYWTSSLRDGNFIYDSINDNFVSIIRNGYDVNVNVNIVFSKKNTIYYEVNLNENEKLKFIYNIK